MRPLVVPPRNPPEAAPEAADSPARLDIVPDKAANENAPANPGAALHWPANTDRRLPAAPSGRMRQIWRLAALLTALTAHGALAAGLWAYLHRAPPPLPQAEDQAILIDMVSIAAPAAATPQMPADPVVRQSAAPALAPPAQEQATRPPVAEPSSPTSEKPAPDARAKVTPTPATDGARPPARDVQTTQKTDQMSARKPHRDMPNRPRKSRNAAQHPSAPAIEHRSSATRSGTDAQRSSMDYAARIAAHLMRHKRQPGGRERTGRVSVAFSLDRAGRLTTARVAAPAAASLNDAALATVRSASPFPAPPADVKKLTFVVPIRFTE